jgi:hypothetical protein
MKYLIYLFTIVLIGSSCSQIKNKQKKSQLDERIENSKFSTEYKLIKEIIEDTDVLIDKDNVFGCIENDFNEYGGCQSCPDWIRDEFNTSDLIIIKEYSNNINIDLFKKKNLEFLVIHTKMPGADYGITFEFYRIDNKWCLNALRFYQPEIKKEKKSIKFWD